MQTETLTSEQAFRSLLDKKQLRALDHPETVSGWKIVHVPVETNSGTWYIRFVTRPTGAVPYSAAVGREKNCPICFHALAPYTENQSINMHEPYTAAIAFLCQLQADAGWISRGGEYLI